ncbi:hypothetical protein CLIB1423_13S03466 [[Candida] railenensis]|uniref:Uncharacterized protein n=1 Tax=[Candida] railenensis TaxID=45579 RepID=A0A9P0QS95_9ASCO|nr:hypothetical protein CLIB1423_13S03466 [[Candida] railenensis]
MLFDNGYCVVDGNPCEQGSVYCSEQCRDSDLMENQNVFFNGDEENDPLESLTEESATYYDSPIDSMELDDSPTYLLYECCLCKSTHQASSPCSHHQHYRLDSDPLDLNSAPISNNVEYLDSQLREDLKTRAPLAPTILETLQSYTKYSEDDSSVAKSNLSIQHNYRKWLVMGSS